MLSAFGLLLFGFSQLGTRECFGASCEGNLLVNGDFSAGLAGWTPRIDQGCGGTRTVEVIPEDSPYQNVLVLKSVGAGGCGGGSHAYQDLAINLSNYECVTVSASVKAVEATVGAGCGWTGVEYPALLVFYYLTASGEQKYLYIAFYYGGGTCGYPEPHWDITWLFCPVSQGVWHEFTSPNLKEVIPDAVTITGLQASACGWDYEGRIDNITVSGPSAPVVVAATIDFDPNTLNLKSHGRWVTSYIELPQGYNVADIDIASVMLNGSIHAEERPSSIGDYDDDGRPDLMVKVDRSAVGAILTTGQNVQITVTGNVGSQPFSGTDYIRVINPPVIPPKNDSGTSAAGAITLELRPNPFNPSVEIAYGVPEPTRVIVQILSVDGRLVKTLEDAERSGGLYTIMWDGRDSAGRDVSSGLYFCRLVVGSEVITKKLTILR